MRGFSEPKFDEDMINHLVMDPQRKQLLKSLAKSFARINKHGEKLLQAPWTADFVQGKVSMLDISISFWMLRYIMRALTTRPSMPNFFPTESVNS
jgi:hypothetical protein